MTYAEGADMTWTAHYWRYGEAASEECGTLDEAVAFLAAGWEAGDLAQDKITGPDGAVVLTDVALFQRMRPQLGL